MADITIGKAAESAGKSLTCALRLPSPHAAPNCLYLRYRAQWDLKGAPARVVTDKIPGASADLKRIVIPGVDVMISIP